MGRGIAQLAAQAGSQVYLYDLKAEAGQKARIEVFELWDKLLEKGRITGTQHQAYKSRLLVADDWAKLSDAALVVEAISENLAAKVDLFSKLEAVVSESAILATNTSSLSISAIARTLKYSQRLAGFHFFNPAPLMKVVEIVAGIHTKPSVCQALSQYAREMGHTPVLAQDTPGFIVNHAGRAYSTEALRIAGEGVADYVTIDRILKDQLGFKLGPFELMDLTGLDVSHPVMESIYHQYFQEPRYRPHVITAQRFAGGILGRKTGQGFYNYAQGTPDVPAEPAVPQIDPMPPVWVSSRAARRADLYKLLQKLGARIETGPSPSPQALIMVAPLGFDVTTVAVVERLDPSRTLGIDLLVDDATTRRRVLATNPATRQDMREAAHAQFARDHKAVSVIKDSAGFVTQRVAASIVNVASDICQQGICSPADLETAVTLGLGYPVGPLALGNVLGPSNVLEVLFNMQTVYGDPRYRPSPWLRRRGAIGLSLLQEESDDSPN
jgi:3-hydroxybutyryl-CoA dehydrogenase